MGSRIAVLCFLLAVVAIGLAGCGDASPAGSPGTGRLRVVCTTTMIADLATVIAGDAAEVRGLMRPGEDPHLYEVRPQDAQVLSDAGLVLTNGLHLEGTLQGVIRNSVRRGKVVALAEDPRIKPLGGQGGSGAADPHCWFNVRYFRIYAERTRDALVAADPTHAQDYQARAEAYLKELDALDAWAREELSRVPRARRVIVTSHDAFSYFGQAYDVEVHAVIGISTEQQPRPQDIERLVSLVRQRNVRALFIETSTSRTLNDMVRRIAADTGARVGGTLYSDSLAGPGEPAGTYIGMVRHNVRTVVEGLR